MNGVLTIVTVPVLYIVNNLALPVTATKSYGIHVARLAGVPDAVIRRAREALRARSELSMTRIDDPLMAAAAIRGVTTPLMATWSATGQAVGMLAPTTAESTYLAPRVSGSGTVTATSTVLLPGVNTPFAATST